MNLAENAVSEQSTHEFIEVIANNHQALVTFMEADKSFSESFKMSCVRISNHSSYLYHFLGALKLVGEDRPTSFATVINLLHTVTSPKRHHKMMSRFLIKVTLFFGCLISGAYAKDYNIETTADHVLIYSSIDTVKYTEISEIYPLDPILNQIVKLNKTLSLIQGLLKFTVNNRDCTTFGNSNANTDHI